MSEAWQVKIVGHAEVDPRTLTGHPLNPKIHPKAQHAVVEASLTELGWVKSVIVNQVTGHVLDGHERLALAVRRGEPRVPVEYVEVPAADEGKVLLLLDQTAQLAQVHTERWLALRQQVQVGQEALQIFLAEQALAQALPADAITSPALEPQQDPAVVAPAASQPGGRRCPTCGAAVEPEPAK